MAHLQSSSVFSPFVLSVFFFIRKGSSFNYEWVHKSFSYITAMLGNSLPAKIRKAQGIEDFKNALRNYVFIFLAAWFTIYYYHNYCDLFIDNVKRGRSRELWVCKELDYDGGRRLRTFITAQNSLERRMVVLYCCHIFVLWCNWNDDLPGCSVLKSKLERLSLCKEIDLTKWCIFYSKMSLFICEQPISDFIQTINYFACFNMNHFIHISTLFVSIHTSKFLITKIILQWSFSS